MAYRYLLFLLFFAACGKTPGSSSAKSDDSEPYVEEPQVSQAEGTDASSSPSYGYEDTTTGNVPGQGASAYQWCLYGPGALGGTKFKGKFAVKQDCLNARSLFDYCDPC